MSENISPIDEKKNEQSGKSNEKLNWMGFLKDTLSNIIVVIIWGFIGANFIYFMHSNLDGWFPDNPNQPPYAEARKNSTPILQRAISHVRKAFSGGKYNDGCTPVYESPEATAKLLQIKEKLGMNKLSSPYDGITDEIGAKALFSNFFGSSARYSYIMARRLLKSIFKGLQGMGGKGETILFVLVPLILMAMLFQVPLIFGFLSTLWGEITSSKFGWFWTWIFLFFFGISLLWPLAVGLAQMIQFLVTMLIMPMYTDFGMVKEILSCNSHLLGGLFGLLTITAASANLNVILTVVIGLTLLFLWYKRK